MKDEAQKARYLQLLERTLTLLPSTQRNLVIVIQALIDETDTVLDVGCGMKSVTRYLACKLTGVDIAADCLVDGDICGDIRDLPNLLQGRGFNIVVCVDVIEHLTKAEGLKLLADMEGVATKKVMVITPTRWSPNIESVKDPKFWSHGNVYDYHRSAWDLDEFYARGYVSVPADFSNEFFLVVKNIAGH